MYIIHGVDWKGTPVHETRDQWGPALQRMMDLTQKGGSIAITKTAGPAAIRGYCDGRR